MPGSEWRKVKPTRYINGLLLQAVGLCMSVGGCVFLDAMHMQKMFKQGDDMLVESVNV